MNDIKNKVIDKTLAGLYRDYGKIVGTGIFSRFMRWIILKEIKKYEDIKKSCEGLDA